MIKVYVSLKSPTFSLPSIQNIWRWIWQTLIIRNLLSKQKQKGLFGTVIQYTPCPSYRFHRHHATSSQVCSLTSRGLNCFRAWHRTWWTVLIGLWYRYNHGDGTRLCLSCNNSKLLVLPTKTNKFVNSSIVVMIGLLGQQQWITYEYLLFISWWSRCFLMFVRGWLVISLSLPDCGTAFLPHTAMLKNHPIHTYIECTCTLVLSIIHWINITAYWSFVFTRVVK